jgi:outer membrane immunogenic protein
MNKLLFLAGIFATASLVETAAAADIGAPVYEITAPPIISPATWTGLYAGINVGYGIGHDPSMESTDGLYGGPRNYAVVPAGVIGGGQVGYNYQFAPTWVAGLETDLQGSGMKNRQDCILACGALIVPTSTLPPGLSGFTLPVAFSDFSEQHQIGWFGTVRGRIGYSTGRVLVYGTGGLAYGSVERSGSVSGTTFNVFPLNAPPHIPFNTFAGSYNNNSVNVGWTVGAGIEGKIVGSLSVKAEYLYIDLGSTTDTLNTAILTGGTGSAGVRTDVSRYHENIFRLGLNYQIGG